MREELRSGAVNATVREAGTLTIGATPARVLRLVGLDTGLAAFGYAEAEIRPTGLVFVGVEVWRTKPSPARRRLRKCDDTADRVRFLAARLHEAIGVVRPVALCVEAVALPFGKSKASVISALGRSRGVVDALAEVHRLPVLEETAARLKQATAGTASASKVEVQTALEAAYPELRAMFAAVLPSMVEHCSDAAASIVACRNSDVVLAALRAREAT